MTLLSFDLRHAPMHRLRNVRDSELSHSVGKEIIKLDEARRLVARALALVVDAGDTLAAAELEQALDTITRRIEGLNVSSGSSASRSSAIQ